MGMGSDIMVTEISHINRYSIARASENQLSVFLSVLPQDWKVELERTMLTYRGEWFLVLISFDKKVIGGGMLFKSLTEDVMMYQNVVKSLVEKGLQYIAYVWIDPEHRGFKLGNKWLDYVQKNIEARGFWLSIEDKGLVGFYEASGFRILKQVVGPNGLEWIMVSRSSLE